MLLRYPLSGWAGQGDASTVRLFEDIEHFDQLLIRAAVRMLLLVSHLGGVGD